MSPQHILQFYESDTGSPGPGLERFIDDGLSAGGCLVLIAPPDRLADLKAVLDSLETDLDETADQRRYISINAEELLNVLYFNGALSAQRFENTIGAKLRELVSSFGSRGVYVYADVVCTLWKNGRKDDAVQLERLWSDLQKELPLELFCAYCVDIFDESYPSNSIAAALAAHTSVVPRKRNRELQCALDFAMYETFGEVLPPMRDADAAVLWLHEHAPKQATQILKRAQLYTKGTI